jgi:hypothetical protein
MLSLLNGASWIGFMGLLFMVNLIDRLLDDKPGELIFGWSSGREIDSKLWLVELMPSSSILAAH